MNKFNTRNSNNNNSSSRRSGDSFLVIFRNVVLRNQIIGYIVPNKEWATTFKNGQYPIHLYDMRFRIDNNNNYVIKDQLLRFSRLINNNIDYSTLDSSRSDGDGDNVKKSRDHTFYQDWIDFPQFYSNINYSLRDIVDKELQDCNNTIARNGSNNKRNHPSCYEFYGSRELGIFNELDEPDQILSDFDDGSNGFRDFSIKSNRLELSEIRPMFVNAQGEVQNLQQLQLKIMQAYRLLAASVSHRKEHYAHNLLVLLSVYPNLQLFDYDNRVGLFENIFQIVFLFNPENYVNGNNINNKNNSNNNNNNNNKNSNYSLLKFHFLFDSLREGKLAFVRLVLDHLNEMESRYIQQNIQRLLLEVLYDSHYIYLKPILYLFSRYSEFIQESILDSIVSIALMNNNHCLLDILLHKTMVRLCKPDSKEHDQKILARINQCIELSNYKDRTSYFDNQLEQHQHQSYFLPPPLHPFIRQEMKELCVPSQPLPVSTAALTKAPQQEGVFRDYERNINENCLSDHEILIYINS
ncbi:hypothetical protein CYY_007930 [Polysphondylium violaceum]|uniref:Uncharacterized protein n=1 Tax=Polysphondylium violaceum TaxID=133409 RepID=A0A8J4PNY0_9MYCE|nr:hypothetical protein CYY_007930 [Polysphondylium violaceum]